MLVLTRKEGEQVQIGPDICVTVVRIEGGGVRIGVEAPDTATVWRSEVMDTVSHINPADLRGKES